MTFNNYQKLVTILYCCLLIIILLFLTPYFKYFLTDFYMGGDTTPLWRQVMIVVLAQASACAIVKKRIVYLLHEPKI